MKKKLLTSAIFLILTALVPVFLWANTPKLAGAFLKIEGLQVQFYKIKIEHKDGGGSDYEFQTSLENGKIYLHPLPDHVKANISVIPVTTDFVPQSPYMITNQELVAKWYSSVEEGCFASHNFNYISADGRPISELASSSDLVHPSEEIPLPKDDHNFLDIKSISGDELEKEIGKGFPVKR